MMEEKSLGRSMQITKEKTGAKIAVYCPTRLQQYLGTLPKNGKHILAKNLTEPLGKRQVQKTIEEERRAIGVMEGSQRLVPHGWRYTAAKELCDERVPGSQIQAVTGHKTLEMVAKYRTQRDQKAASKRAQITRKQNKTRT
ncbi:tyrosine-type recombinase/integrase [Celeribacter sp.]|uniref:tyrosine-type recombinase/integrase n=1 Tax=Celeribacter sp. TaxID=1890673 RepID=UPI003A9459B6